MDGAIAGRRITTMTRCGDDVCRCASYVVPEGLTDRALFEEVLRDASILRRRFGGRHEDARADKERLIWQCVHKAVAADGNLALQGRGGETCLWKFAESRLESGLADADAGRYDVAGVRTVVRHVPVEPEKATIMAAGDPDDAYERVAELAFAGAAAAIALQHGRTLPAGQRRELAYLARGVDTPEFDALVATLPGPPCHESRATAMHALQNVRNLLAEEPYFESMTEDLAEAIKSRRVGGRRRKAA
jgi:hypothetical protein